MKVAIIAPTPLLGTYGILGDRYHLCLSQEIAKCRSYARFYRERSIDGDFVILDNSAHETGFGDSENRLEQAIREVNPSEVVLPDRLFFGEDTLDGSREASKKIRARYPHLRQMGVPQGRIMDEWLGCLEGLIHEVGVDTIGISKDYEVWEGGLWRLLECTLEQIGRARRPIEIHLLGWGRYLNDLRDILNGYPVRGIDSAKPLVYASAGIRLDLDQKDPPPYPKRSAFFETAQVDHDLALHNINVFKQFAKSESSAWDPVPA